MDKDSLSDDKVFPDGNTDKAIPQMKTYYNNDWDPGDNEEETGEFHLTDK